jgi:antitoxin (DNA-binding transcriptional repressor) of toxin-antitoxin stability system
MRSTLVRVKIVTKRDLNQHTAQVLGLITDADAVVVTERGRPRWQVTTYRAQSGALERLEREGRISAAVDAPAPWPDRSGSRAYTSDELDALLDEMKGDH